MRCATKLRQMSVMRNEQYAGRYSNGKASRDQVVFWLLKGHHASDVMATDLYLRNENGSGKAMR